MLSGKEWCANSSSYLLLDLKNEYHITKVVIMGNKEQKKWSESYLLKYSHNKTLLDSIKAVEVKFAILYSEENSKKYMVQANCNRHD